MSGQSAGKVSYTEKNSQKQGKSGTGTPKKKGPATGKTSNPNPTKSGGIFRPTKGKM